MQINISQKIKDIFEDTTNEATLSEQWERDWKMISSLHFSLPEQRNEKLCSLFLRLSTVFESAIFIQKKNNDWKQLLCFSRGEIKTPLNDSIQMSLGGGKVNIVEKTDSAQWKNLFSPYFKNDLDKVSIYKIFVDDESYFLVADRLPDPWMKRLMSETFERILRGIA